MFRSNTLIAAVLSAAALLSATGPVQAQRRGVYYGARPYYAPYFAPYRHYYYPRYVYPPVYSTYWYAPTYAYPPYSNYYVPPTSTYAAPATSYGVQPATATSATADVRVLVPDPLAIVYFDGQRMTTMGAERMFHTPPLTMGSTYTYSVRAVWTQAGREVTQDRTVSVMAGFTSVVDFTQPGTETLPSAPLRN